jgi:DNA segregation ATPase FtsK/SpoIIIE, S-DNA-T family
VRERRGSVSLLQRCLGIGYGRAARLIDFMAEDKIVGEYNGAQAREVLISIDDWEAMSGSKGDDGGSSPAAGPAPPLTAATVPPKPRRITKILPGADEPSDLEDAGPPASSPLPSRRASSPLTASASAGATALLAAPWETRHEPETDEEGLEEEVDEEETDEDWSEVENDDEEDEEDLDEDAEWEEADEDEEDWEDDELPEAGRGREAESA